MVDCKFVPDAVQPISSGSSNPYHGEFGTACLSSALGRPCKDNGKDMCTPDVTAGCNENGNGCVDVFKAPTACKSPYSGGTSKTAVASQVVAVSAALAMLAAGIGQAFIRWDGVSPIPISGKQYDACNLEECSRSSPEGRAGIN